MAKMTTSLKMKLYPMAALMILSTFLTTFTESTHPPFSCDSANPLTKSLLFCDKKLPIETRVKDLVSRLTVDEKINQLFDSAPAIPRLGIPGYEWWSESLHGICSAGHGMVFGGRISGATSFPQVILTAATFDDHLWYRIGQAMGREARAMYNAGHAKGMTFWAPNINIFRDPRWGRGQETPGEDPFAAGKYAVSYVRGLQGDSFKGGKMRDNGHLQASALCKHFTAYDLEDWKGNSRYTFNAQVTKQDMADTYQPPFLKCIQEGRASGLMCSYNKVNGVPACVNYDLLTNTARQQWHFHGYITSDCGAVQFIHDMHKYVNTLEDAVTETFKAGVDIITCGEQSHLLNHTRSAVHQKKVTNKDMDRALYNLFAVRMRLGLFNGSPQNQVFGNISPNEICSKKHLALALEAAKNGIVLLKNSAKLLPLSKAKTYSLAVIGPSANNASLLRGNYEGPPCTQVDILQALHGYVKNIQYHPGCNNGVNCTSAAIVDAVNVAKHADYVVLFMGLDYYLANEGLDREDLRLPGQQQSLITAVSKASKKPVVLVIISGTPVDISFAKYDSKIGSILWAGYPGEAGGLALSEILFGEHNPGGKLPVTWYPQDFVKVPMTDMRMRPDPTSGYPGRTYRFYKGETVFEFGYGLSYTKYSYEFTSATHNTLHLNQISSAFTRKDSSRYISVSEMGTDSCHKVKFSAFLKVENSGEMAGRHPVLLFARHEKNTNEQPVKQLIGFQSVSLNPNESAEIEFVVSPCEHLSWANEDGLMLIEEGYHYLVVGDKEYPINVLF